MHRFCYGVAVVLAPLLIAGCSDAPVPGNVVAGSSGSSTSGGSGGAGTTSGGGAPSVPGDLLWSRAYGGPLDDNGGPLVVDARGHAYFSPKIGGAADLGTGTQTFEYRPTIVEIDPDGALVAVRPIFSDGSGNVDAMDFDGEGNLVITGVFSKSVDLGNGCSLGAKPGRFVAKLDPEGACLWARSFAVTARAMTLSVSPSGQVAIAGIASSGGDLGSGVTLPVYPGWSPVDVPCVMVLDGEGAPLWARTFAPEMGYGGIALGRFDSGGALVVAGHHADTMKLDATHTLAPGAFVVRYTPKGDIEWIQAAGDAKTEMRHLAVGPSGEVILGGRYGHAFGFGTVLPEPANTIGSFLVALHGADGVELWSQALSDGNAFFDASVDGAGNIRLAGGFFVGTQVTLGGEALPAASSARTIVEAKLDSGGKLLWKHVDASPTDLELTSIHTSAIGATWMLGMFVGAIDFGDGVHDAHVSSTPGEDGARDIYLLKRSP